MRIAESSGMGPIVLSRLPAQMGETLDRKLQRAGFRTATVATHEALLEVVLDQPPCALVHLLQPAPTPDLAMLRIVRRAAPGMPLILLAAHGSLATQREIVDLRPVFYDVLPVDMDDLMAAVRTSAQRCASQKRPRQDLRSA